MSSRATAKLRNVEGRSELLAPRVGLWDPWLPIGGAVHAGTELGLFEVLGHRVIVVAPLEATGLVCGPAASARFVPIGYGDVLFELGAGAAAALALSSEPASAAAGALTFRSPMSGRFYARSAPDKPPFVSVGDVIEVGRTLALLEVMKTFNRVQYGGEALPERARVVRVVAAPESDVGAGDVLFELEAV